MSSTIFYNPLLSPGSEVGTEASDSYSERGFSDDGSDGISVVSSQTVDSKSSEQIRFKLKDSISRQFADHQVGSFKKEKSYKFLRKAAICTSAAQIALIETIVRGVFALITLLPLAVVAAVRWNAGTTFFINNGKALGVSFTVIFKSPFLFFRDKRDRESDSLRAEASTAIGKATIINREVSEDLYETISSCDALINIALITQKVTEDAQLMLLRFVRDLRFLLDEMPDDSAGRLALLQAGDACGKEITQASQLALSEADKAYNKVIASAKHASELVEFAQPFILSLQDKAAASADVAFTTQTRHFDPDLFRIALNDKMDAIASSEFFRLAEISSDKQYDMAVVASSIFQGAEYMAKRAQYIAAVISGIARGEEEYMAEYSEVLKDLHDPLEFTRHVEVLTKMLAQPVVDVYRAK